MRIIFAAVIVIMGCVGIARSPAYVNSGGPRCVACNEPATFLADMSPEWLRLHGTNRYCPTCYWKHARAATPEEYTLAYE